MYEMIVQYPDNTYKISKMPTVVERTAKERRTIVANFAVNHIKGTKEALASIAQLGNCRMWPKVPLVDKLHWLTLSRKIDH